jgi:hypothetical protein
LVFISFGFLIFLRLKDERKGGLEIKPGCRENGLRMNRPVDQASPRPNGASRPELIPMVSGFAQTALTYAETDSDLNCA